MNKQTNNYARRLLADIDALAKTLVELVAALDKLTAGDDLAKYKEEFTKIETFSNERK